MNIDDILEITKDNGYKITKTRKAIITSLYLSKGKLLTVDNILSNAKSIYENINMTTIYRNIDMLSSLNLLHKSNLDDGTSVYQLVCCETHHHHLICSKCGITEVINYCPLSQLKKIANNKNFTLTNHKLEIYGYCKNCNKK